MSRVLNIGDIHNPVAHPGYLAFCQDLRDKYRCDTTMFIGDVVDWHAISFHSKHPDAPGPKDEYELSKLHIQNWYRAFPKARVCIGNHDARVVRLAEEQGIPSCLIRSFAEAWETPGWEWENNFTLDDVYYFHGIGTSGIHPAFNSMCKMLMSVVQGHIHSAGGIKWRANPVRRIFGMDTGCGIDDRAYAFAYGQDQKVRSILSAGVVIDGVPHHEIMPIGPGEKYHRSRFAAGVNANEKVSVLFRGGTVGRSADRRLFGRLSAGGSKAGNPSVKSSDSRNRQPDEKRGQGRKRPGDNAARPARDSVRQRDRGKVRSAAR